MNGPMDELRDSAAHARDPAALRALIRAEGYVFVRGALDRTTVLAAGQAAFAALQSAGWLRSGSPATAAAISPPPRPSDPKAAWADPGYRAFAASPELNRLPYEAALGDLMLTLMGNTAFCYPTKVARVVYPAALVPVHGGRYIHQDWSVIGVPDMFTVWTPLMDIPRNLGGLALRPGSQAGPLLAPRLLDSDEPGWATADYRAGDVVVFHCLTAHASLPNRGDGLRVSAEFRWQLADVPVPRHLVYGPRGNGGVELFSRLFATRAWWRPVPAGLHFIDGDAGRRAGPVPPSRYVDARAAAAGRPGGAGGFRPGMVPH